MWTLAGEVKSKVIPQYDSVNGADAIRGCGMAASGASDRISSYPVEMESPENAEDPGQQGEDEVQVHEPTAREKEAVEKLRRNLGHPSNKELSRVLSLSRASPHLIRWAAHGHHCPNCAAHGSPKAVRPSMIPRSYAPNSVVGVDLFQLPNFDGSDQFWMLNMVCHGTSFQLCERVKSKEPQEVWAAFSRSWGRLLGWPQVIIADQGTEFLGDFKGKCSDLGIILRTIGARAPHQQGRTERRGALFKAPFQKAVWDCPPQDHHEWRLLLRETEAAKNTSFNRSGFSSIQRMMGHSPRANGEVMSDDLIDPAFLGHGQEMERLLVAKKAFVEVNSSEAVKAALRSRSRVQRKFSPGEVVFVWRLEGEGRPQTFLDWSRSCPHAGGCQCVCEHAGAPMEGVQRASQSRHFRRDPWDRGSARGFQGHQA